MSVIERMTITMPAEMAAMLKATVAEGQYASTSEVIREALRDWARARAAEQRGLEALRAAIQAGDDSGPSVSAADVYADLRALIDQRRASPA